jgi:hypothetical protein
LSIFALRRLRSLLRARHFAESCSDIICAGEGGIDMNEFCVKKVCATYPQQKRGHNVHRRARALLLLGLAER